MIKIAKFILLIISYIFFIKEKDIFIRKGGIKLKKLLLLIYSLTPFNKIKFFFLLSSSDKYEQYSDLYEIVGLLIGRNGKKNILEIGIGGHDKKISGGNSILALKYIFKQSKIIGFDFEDKSFLDDNRIKTFKGDQSNSDDLSKIINYKNEFDLIIDDGSHFSDHQKKSFQYLYKYLKVGGVYVIEDIQGSYTVNMNGDPNLGKEKNIVTYFSRLVHVTNREFVLDKLLKENDNYTDFAKVFFFKNAILIQKQSKEFEKYPENQLFYTLEEMNKYSNRIKTKDGVIKQ